MRAGGHRQSIDLARFLAAFGVVYTHAEASTRDWTGHLSLGLFLILSAALAVQSAERAGGQYDLMRRLRRVALPWSAWCLFYRALDLVFSDDPTRFQPLRDPLTLLIGPEIHLWFLPFLMLGMVLVQPVARAVTDRRRLAIGCAVLAGLGLPLLWLHEFAGLPFPFAQWTHAIVMYGYGLLWVGAARLGRNGWPFLALLTLTAVLWPFVDKPWLVTVPLAAVLFELFWRLPLRHALLPHLGRAALGIYLVHPFVMLVVYKYLGPLDLWPMTLAVFFGAWACVAVMLRLPLLRAVV